MNRPIYTNDKKAPRMRKSQFSRQVVTPELWKDFTTKHVQYRNMTWKEFREAWLDIAQTIREEIVTNPLGVKLGGYSGELKLQYTHYKVSVINHPASIEQGKKVRFTNLAEKGKVGKIRWERRWAVKFNKMLQFFCFSPTREINRIAYKYVTEYPEKLRMGRNTFGGYSIWRQLKPKN